MRHRAVQVGATLLVGLLIGVPPGRPSLAADLKAASGAVQIVAAENFYGDIASQIAGPGVKVVSILSSPDQDPHLFEASPKVARALATASITIANGAGYDPWMPKLLGAASSGTRRDIDVATLIGARPGSNPHLWYDMRSMKALARALGAALDASDPAHTARYDSGRDRFLASLVPIETRIGAIRRRFGGTMVTATEPVFGLMSNALGLVTRNERFQRATMNDVEPGASEIAAMENDLRGHQVAVLFYNRQATDSAGRRLLAIATASKVPVVGVAETEPRDRTYQQWMLAQLDQVEKALSGSRSGPHSDTHP